MGCSGGQEGSRVKGGPSRGCQGGGRGLLPAGWHRGQVKGRRGGGAEGAHPTADPDGAGGMWGGGGPLNPLSITQCPESPLWLCPPWFISLLEPSLPQQPSSHEQDLGVQRCRGAGRPGGAPRGSNKLGGGAAGRFWGLGGVGGKQRAEHHPVSIGFAGLGHTGGGSAPPGEQLWGGLLGRVSPWLHTPALQDDIWGPPPLIPAQRWGLSWRGGTGATRTRNLHGEPCGGWGGGHKEGPCPLPSLV